MQLHYKSNGSGDPLIILHGVFGMLDNWRSFAKNLESFFSVYVMDLRNHGRSPHDAQMSYPLMAEDVRETMLANGMTDGAYLVGHSMGGKVAMQLALDHPALIRALIVVDIAPVEYGESHEKIIRSLMKIPVSDIGSRNEATNLLSETIEDPAIVAFLMKNLSRNEDGTFRWKMNLPVIAKQYNWLLQAPHSKNEVYSGPSLFVRGGLSSYVPAGSERIIKTQFPQAKVVTIEEAGHWVHADQPVALLRHITEFIAAI
ncbi:MAG: alpha/beta fold hydrolase [Saprospiraceae bacterium]|nr:alpha/beta fold hydrolase [Saprospiraceae bacterium]